MNDIDNLNLLYDGMYQTPNTIQEYNFKEEPKKSKGITYGDTLRFKINGTLYRGVVMGQLGTIQ